MEALVGLNKMEAVGGIWGGVDMASVIERTTLAAACSAAGSEGGSRWLLGKLELQSILPLGCTVHGCWS